MILDTIQSIWLFLSGIVMLGMSLLFVSSCTPEWFDDYRVGEIVILGSCALIVIGLFFMGVNGLKFLGLI